MRLHMISVLLFSGLSIASASDAEDAGAWGGFYTGFQIGGADFNATDRAARLSDDGGLIGAHAGYNHDFGAWVLGAEVDYDRVNADLPVAGQSSVGAREVSRVKFRAGYDFGQAMVYATAGPARAGTSAGDESGEVYGIGVSYEISSRFVVSGEMLNHEFSQIGSTPLQNLEAETINLRFSLRF